MGDRLLRKNQVLSSVADNFMAKIALKSICPCVVEKVLPRVVYEVTDVETNRIVKVQVPDVKKRVKSLKFNKNPSTDSSGNQNVSRTRKRPWNPPRARATRPKIYNFRD